MRTDFENKRAEAGVISLQFVSKHALQARLEARAVRTAQSPCLVVTYRSKRLSLSFVSMLAVDRMESVSFAARWLAGLNSG